MPWPGGCSWRSMGLATPTTSRSGPGPLDRSRSTCRPTDLRRALVEPDREQALEVVLRVDLERDERLGPRDALHLRDPTGDHGRQIVVVRDAHDRDQVELTGHGVDLRD